LFLFTKHINKREMDPKLDSSSYYDFRSVEGQLAYDLIAKKDSSLTAAKTCALLKEYFSSPSVIDRQSKEKLKIVLVNLEERFKTHILKKHTFFGKFICFLQEKIGFGALGAIKECQRKLLQLQTKEESLEKFLSDLENPPALFQSSLEEDVSHNCRWLSLMLSSSPLNDRQLANLCNCMEKSKAPLLQNIVQRYRQLEKAPIEDQPPSNQELFRIALYIETTMKSIETVSDIQFKMFTNLARSLQIDAEGEAVYLLSKHAISKVRSKASGFKNLSLALRLPLKNRVVDAEVVARLVTKGDLQRFERLSVKEEIRLAKRLQGNRGIAELYHVRNYSRISSGKLVQRVGFFYKKYDGSLHTGSDPAYAHFIENELRKPDRFQDRLQIAEDLAHGLKQMHELGIIHGDIKPGNVLIQRQGDRVVGARITDFGSAFDRDTNRDILSTSYGHNSYGTPECSPPEMVGENRFQGNDKACDMWALGCTLYELEFGDDLPWQKAFRRSFDRRKPFPKELLLELIDAIRQKLAGKNGTQQQKEYFALIVRLLDPAPEGRLTAQQVAEEIRRIKTFT
jgi:serine/threonine protein kinase